MAICVFKICISTPTGDRSTGIFSQDFDGDGDNDLAVANRESNNLTVLYNNGEGQFNDSAQVETGDHPRYVDGADFDGDGDIDLCTPDFYGMTTSILENDGDGNFIISQQYKLFSPAYLWVDDLDNDGFQDIVTLHWDGDAKKPGNSNGFFRPMFGKGDGTFEIGDPVMVGIQPRGGDSADLNGDGFIDAIVADIKSQTISIVMGTSPRSWQDGISIDMSPGAPRYISLDDFDNDGDVDCAALDKDGGNFWLFHNDGNANFALEQTVEVNSSPHSMDIVDIDGDNDLDFIVSHVDSGTQFILYNDGTGHVNAMQGISMSGGAAEVKCSDLNNDGMLDIVTANVNDSSPGASVLLQRECLVCNGDTDCPPESSDINLNIDSFTVTDIQLIGESFSGNAIDYVITSLPSSGQLKEPNGLIVSSVPYYLSSDTVRYFPQNGHVGLVLFQYQVNDCLPSSLSTVIIEVDYPYPDECNTSFEIINGYTDISTVNASDSQEDFDDALCVGTNLGEMRNDIWLKYVACADGELFIDTCGMLNFDSDLVVYKGTCCALSQIGCNGDAVGCDDSSTLVIPFVETGDEYFIRLGGAVASAAGNGSIYIDGPFGACVESCYGDVIVDGIVNVADLLYVLGEWGSTCGSADLNVDGIVDVVDFLLVIGTWGPCSD